MPTPPTPTPARATLEQAVAHHRAGRLAEAEQLYLLVLQHAPQNADANHNLGLIAFADGQRNAALPLFQAALQADPLQPQFLASLANTLLTMGRNGDACVVLQQGFARGVRHPALEALLKQAEEAQRGNSANGPQQEEKAALFQLFQLGLHAEVQQEARRLLAQFPDAGFLWKILGASLQLQGGDADDTLAALRKAAALLPQEADAQNNLAIVLRRRGEIAEAAYYARRALQAMPDFVEAQRTLGAVLCDLRDFSGAEEQFRRALARKPDSGTRINLSVCLLELGRHAEAQEQLRIAADEGCDSAALHAQMGVALQLRAQPDEAALAYRRALERDPGLFATWNNLGNILQDQGRTEEAIDYYRRALDANPGYADAYNNLGVAQRELGRREEAVASFNNAIAYREHFVEALSNLGNLLQEMGRTEEALAHCRKSVEINPQFAEAHSNLGNVLHGAMRYDEALASFQRAILLKHHYADAHSSLSALYRDMGRIEDAVQSSLTALQCDPNHLDAHSSLLFSCNFLANETGPVLLAHAQRYGISAAKRARPTTSWVNAPDPTRRLRVGFVSADLQRHPVGFFLDSVIAALHEKYGASLELHAYANSPKHDELTERLQRHFDGWHKVFGLPDAKLARRIRDDGIDILIDLAGHTTGTRLAAFAWKPAPVQASWLGYFATTGLAEMDYLVADPWTLLPEEELNFSETIWRLPETRLCFSAPDIDVDAGPLPALANGYITFGCCNNLSKLGDAVVALWARVLHAVPGSRLLLKNKQFSEAARREDTLRRFAAHGVAGQRLILEGPSGRADYLAAHQRIDIALDPFPYTGGTTTAEALWMGVPVLTLAGQRFIARQGVGLLANAGLPDWIAADAEGYLAKAVAFASDLSALARLRASLRAQVLASPLFDAPRFAGHFEAMLRSMWRAWCDSQTNTVAQAS